MRSTILFLGIIVLVAVSSTIGLSQELKPIPEKERAALIAIYEATRGDNWSNNDNWKKPPLEPDGFGKKGTEHTWYGVEVSEVVPGEYYVTELSLSYNNLNGFIPCATHEFTFLKRLCLSGNPLLTGISYRVGELSLLEKLFLKDVGIKSFPEELGNLYNLKMLDLSHNSKLKEIPPWIQNLVNLEYLYLNDLGPEIKEIPDWICNLKKLKGIMIWGGCFDTIPEDITQLQNLSSESTAFDYNALYVEDEGIRSFLFTVDPDWEKTQTVPPKDLGAYANSSNSITVQWCPILYTQDKGCYVIYYSDSPDGPWKEAGRTSDKSESSCEVKGLLPGKTYYFYVETVTEPHSNNSNRLVSKSSDMVSAETLPGPVVHKLTLESSPPGVTLTADPKDNHNNGNVPTPFNLFYNTGTTVQLAAPSSFQGKGFSYWIVNGVKYTSNTISVTVDKDLNAKVYYGLPKIGLNRTRLNFGYAKSGTVPGSQKFSILSIDGIINWTAEANASWIKLEPSSGSSSGVATVSVDPYGLSVGTHTGTITISDPNASNSPQKVEVKLEVYKSGSTQSPYGAFDTPANGSVIKGGVAVTGWALDDIGTRQVQISVKFEFDIEPIYIGDAVFVEGARPDVEQAYPDYPENYKAGWGYMMLTNCFPDGGNGKCKIYAIATDQEGNQVTLGTKTVICDNANAVKPFGAIDTPTQGGTASGSNYINWGWVLTPQPNYIPTDGSTILVFIDGVNLGSPAYNTYRPDVANLFPDYANSNGAGGYFYLDTTAYTNGMHTIQWVATDDAGNTDGIGSRYFTIQNANIGSTQMNKQQAQKPGYQPGGKNDPLLSITSLTNIPMYYQAVQFKKGYKENIEPKTIFPDNNNGIVFIQINELERIEIYLHPKEERTYPWENIGKWMGYQLVDDQLRSLPIGSTLDIERGIFYWQPGPGFIGEYGFVFICKRANDDIAQTHINVTIKSQN